MNRKQLWLPVLLVAALGSATLFAAYLPLPAYTSDQTATIMAAHYVGEAARVSP